MTNPKRPRADRFVSRDGDFTVERGPGRPRLRGALGLIETPSLKLAQARVARNMSQVELADALGTGQGRISRIENAANPQLATVLGYLRGLGAENVRLQVAFEDGEEVTLELDAVDEPARI